MIDSLAQRRAEIVLAVGGALLLIVALLVGGYVYQKHEWAKARISEVEPRYARMLGLRDSTRQLEQGIEDARSALSRLGHPSEREAAQIGNELQQVVRRALQAAGLVVVSSQVMPSRTEAGVERIAVVAQSSGSLAGLQLFLAAVQGESPAVATDGLRIQATGRSAPDGSPLVSIQHTLSVMRGRP